MLAKKPDAAKGPPKGLHITITDMPAMKRSNRRKVARWLEALAREIEQGYRDFPEVLERSMAPGDIFTEKPAPKSDQALANLDRKFAEKKAKAAEDAAVAARAKADEAKEALGDEAAA